MVKKERHKHNVIVRSYGVTCVVRTTSADAIRPIKKALKTYLPGCEFLHTDANADTLADPYVFLVFALASVGLFAFFATLGVLNRHRPDRHKRLMLLATMSLITPALARIVTQIVQGAGIVGVPGVVGAAILVNVFLAALVIHDLATRRQLHPVTLWGGGFFLLSEPLRFVIGFSAPWQAFAKTLMG